jgi:hypothetical protein
VSVSSGLAFGERYRTVPETTIVGMLRLLGFALEPDVAYAERTVQQALGRWITGGLEYTTDSSGQRCFDSVEVIHFLKRAGVAAQDPFWEQHYVSTARRVVTELGSMPGDVVEVELCRTISVNAPPGKAVRLRAPAPLPGVHGGSLSITNIAAEGLDDIRVAAACGRVEARGLSRGRGEAVIRVTYKFPRNSASVDPPGPLYVEPREGLIVVTAEIKRLAEYLAGSAPHREAALRNFWTYMISELKSGPIHHDQLDPGAPCDWIVRCRWCDCLLASALFVALCRAINIPARIVGGYFLYPKAPTSHYWAEAWLDALGWLPVDFVCWDLSLAGQDPTWSNRFFGRIDARMVVERLPLEFTGPIGAKIPAAWRLIQTPAVDGARIDLEGIDGLRVTSDEVKVRIR